MVHHAVLEFIQQHGLFLEKDVFDLLQGVEQPEIAATLLQTLMQSSGQKFITRNLLTQHSAVVLERLHQFGDARVALVERMNVTLGVSVSVERKLSVAPVVKTGQRGPLEYKIFYADTSTTKKLTVQDFVGHFRSRYQQLQKILMQRSELLTNLVSINKLSSQRSNVSIIGILKEKYVTKNKNMFLTFEDLTGEIKILVRHENAELYGVADELQLDDIVGVKASGDKSFLMAHEIIFPDSFLPQKTYFQDDISVAFLSDIHAGSNLHLGKSMGKFLEWINSDHPEAKKIKYIFFVGDNVDGVGIFPGQEHLLVLKSMREQYALLASYLSQIPKHITMFMCPGQHDSVRVAEPQPIIGKKYAAGLYELENLILVTNPSLIKLCEGEKEFKVLLYHGASIHSFINEIKELRELKAHRCPAKAVRHMLKRRHLAPTHSDVVYIPNATLDPLVIAEVPDILATGEVHRLDIENYNGTLIITGSCWQAQTPFEEKVGNIPDPAKVPVFNLKTRELKVFDFGVAEEIDGSE